MEINHIKFLDPVVHVNKFFSEKEIGKFESKNVEAVGYKIHEDETSFYFSNNATGKDFKRVLCVNKNAIVESQIVEAKTTGQIGDVVQVHYADTSQSATGVVITTTTLRSTKPSLTQTCGFLAFENEENIGIAVEKNQDGKYRTVTIIPKKLLVAEQS
jgi:hypothetical protein